MGIIVPSTLEQPSFSSVSTTEIGSRATQQGVLPVASSATEKHQDGPEVQLSSCPDTYPTTCVHSLPASHFRSPVYARTERKMTCTRADHRLADTFRSSGRSCRRSSGQPSGFRWAMR